jgi:hypothetical protein
MRIVLDEFDFPELVKGKVVEVASKDGVVSIILADIGYMKMIDAIKESVNEQLHGTE